ncbi:hypothetical protein Tco_0456883, partial [Tanacetum coccineum]
MRLTELGCWSAVSDIVLKSIELGVEAKGSLVLELEDLTLETQDAKPVVSESKDLSLLSQETKSLDTELVSKLLDFEPLVTCISSRSGWLEGGMNVPIIGGGTTCILTALTNL